MEELLRPLTDLAENFINNRQTPDTSLQRVRHDVRFIRVVVAQHMAKFVHHDAQEVHSCKSRAGRVSVTFYVRNDLAELYIVRWSYVDKPPIAGAIDDEAEFSPIGNGRFYDLVVVRDGTSGIDISTKGAPICSFSSSQDCRNSRTNWRIES